MPPRSSLSPAGSAPAHRTPNTRRDTVQGATAIRGLGTRIISNANKPATLCLTCAKVISKSPALMQEIAMHPNQKKIRLAMDKALSQVGKK